jgi:hypothetical protein
MSTAVPNQRGVKRVPSKRRSPNRGKKAATSSRRRKIAALTPSAEELFQYAAEHPVPAEFWEGEDDPRVAAGPAPIKNRPARR